MHKGDAQKPFYAAWNKPHSDKQIQYDFTYMWNLRTTIKKKKEKVKLRNRAVARWLPGSGGSKRWRIVNQREQTFSYKVNKSWRYNVQHGAIVNSIVLYTCK